MLHKDITEKIIGCSFEVINELGMGFVESIYQRALFIALQDKGLVVEPEKRIPVQFRNMQIGYFEADAIIDNSVVLELKCCKVLLPEHSAQLINYLKATNMAVGLLINVGNKELEWKRMHHPNIK